MLFPIPQNETSRLQALHKYEILDTQAESNFDDLTILVSQICQAPIALISFVDRDRQWFKSRVGLKVDETPRELAFCAHAIMQKKLFVVPDATQDERFASNQLVTGAPFIRSYAGAPLVDKYGHALGTVCAISHFSKEFSDEQKKALEAISRIVMSQLTLRQVIKQSPKPFTFFEK